MGGGAGGSYTVDGRLIEIEDELCSDRYVGVHIVVFVVGVEEHFGVVFEWCSQVFPEGSEGRW